MDTSEHQNHISGEFTQFLGWSKRFEDRPLWRDIRVLAEEFKAEQTPHRWNHLVFAVGNFKRQRGAVIRMPLKSPRRDSTVGEQREVSVVLTNGSEMTLRCEVSTSWKEMRDAIKGLATPSLTTLLAALWPDRHAILDRKTLRSIIGMAGSQNDWHETISSEEKVSYNLSPRFDQYKWYRSHLLNTAARFGIAAQSIDLIDLERALFELDTDVMKSINDKKDPMRPHNWRDFSKHVRDVFERGPMERS